MKTVELLALLKKEGYTTKDIAEYLGVSKQTVMNWILQRYDARHDQFTSLESLYKSLQLNKK